MSLKLEPAYSHKEEVGELFREYTRMLVELDPEFQKSLDEQNYDEELEHLEDKYGLPGGRLYLAWWDGELAGCVGMKQLDNKTGELKRLYVRPAFRGQHLGRKLVERIIEDARSLGYSRLMLDTMPELVSARHMYGSMGFRVTERYNNSPLDTTIFMEYRL